VGTVAAVHLAASKAVDEVVAADLDANRAKGLVHAVGSRKVRPLRLDLSDEDALRRALRGTSLVINAALPKFNLAIMAAALEAGVDYMDLAGGGKSQLALDAKWRREGRTALLGMGEDPGFANVFARHAADAMDEVDAVKIRDGETARSEEHPFICLFSPEVFIEETLEPATVFEEGAWKKVPPFSGREEYPFPPPVGPVPVYNVNHEEVETIPRFLGKRPRFTDFKLALLPDTVQTLQLIGRMGLMRRGGPREALLAQIPPPGSLAGKITGHAAILVEVTGRRGGLEVTHTVWAAMDHVRAARKHGTTGTAWLTGTGAAVGALLLLDHEVPQGGVFVPEQLEPASVLARLKGRDIHVQERVTEMRSLT
jgi:saccharopine dehydrogenase (NAD+, L-lysine-forming)